MPSRSEAPYRSNEKDKIGGPFKYTHSKGYMKGFSEAQYIASLINIPVVARQGVGWWRIKIYCDFSTSSKITQMKTRNKLQKLASKLIQKDLLDMVQFSDKLGMYVNKNKKALSINAVYWDVDDTAVTGNLGGYYIFNRERSGQIHSGIGNFQRESNY